MGVRLSLQVSASQASFVTRVTWRNFRGKTYPEVIADALLELIPMMIQNVVEQAAPVDEVCVHFCFDKCLESAEVAAYLIAGDRTVNEIVAVLPESTGSRPSS
jgi:hypothetical protein